MQRRGRKLLGVFIGAIAGLLLVAPGALAGNGLTASFTTSPAAPVVGQMVTFDGSASTAPSGDSITSYLWNFGDGGSLTTTTATTSHAFAKQGTFTATLTVVDAHGNASAPASEKIVVVPPTSVPVARFTLTPKSPTQGQTAVFNGSKSSDADGAAIETYRWNFGDGAAATTSTPTTTHTYALNGKYAASLTVVDARGVTSPPDTVVIKVKKPTAYKVPPAPKALFTFVPGHPQVGQSIQFNGSKSTGGKHPVTKYMWTFGDGTSTTSAFPVVDHRYNHAGKFRVQLTVQNSAGALSATAGKTVNVRKTKVKKARRIRLSGLGVKVCARRSRHCTARGLRVRFKLSAADSVVLTITGRGGHRVLKRVVLSEPRGHDVAFVRFIGRRRGHYVLRAQPAGGRGAARRFAWHR